MITAAPLVLRIFLNHAPNGQAERWPLLETDWATAWPIAQQLVQARSRVLAADWSIEYASLAQVEAPWLSQGLFQDVLTPLPQWDICRSDKLGLWWNFTTSYGDYQGRFFRGVDRNEIVADRWIREGLQVPAIIPPLPPVLATATKDELWQNTLAMFRTYTACNRYQYDNPHHWEINPFQAVAYKRPAAWRVGRAFSRTSWEALPGVGSPHWTPCGCVTGCSRRYFTTRCRFFAHGPPSKIHYFRAAGGALILPFPTPFWNFAEALEISNGPGVGDLTGPGNRVYSKGVQIGSATGTHWDGDPADFLGGGCMLVANEIPTGAIDGANATFTLTAPPTAGFLWLYKNGLLEQAGVGLGFTLAGNVITMATPPRVGTTLRATYYAC